jgi:dCMP deaminase
VTDWDRRFLELALHVSGWSKDRKRKVGAVIVGPRLEVRALGFNGFPPGVDETIEARHVKPTKLLYVEHAERNALYFSAMVGVPVDGCTLYCTSMPCADCARGVIRSGIKRVVVFRDEPGSGSWAAHWEAARAMFTEAGIDLEEISP